MDLLKGLAEKMEFTGERIISGTNNEFTSEHLHRYALALSFVKGKKVADIACGEGYGSNIMSNIASEVTGIDLDKKTIDFAKKKYHKPNLKFIQSDCVALPFPDHSFDVVISFETIEHILKQSEMIKEIHRILAPDGLLVISSPERKNCMDVLQTPNSFHVKELYLQEFQELISQYFKHQILLFQKPVFGSIIVNEKNKNLSLEEYSGNFDKINASGIVSDPIYNIVIASDNKLNIEIPDSVFNNFGVFYKILSDIYNSKTYKVGSFFLYPIRLIKSLFR